MFAKLSYRLYRLNPHVKLWCSRVLSRAGAAHWITFPQNGYLLRLCPGTEHRWLQPIDAPRPVEAFFRRYLKEGDVVIDAGANVGVFSMVAAMMVRPRRRVYSIEPHPNTFRYLLRHIADNQAAHVKPFQLALGNKIGTVEFSDDSRNDDLNHVLAQGAGPLTVPVCRLDDLAIDGAVDLLKIDVEGYEKFVLEGAASLLRRARCILFEVEDEKCKRFGYNARDLLDLVYSHGFRIMRIVDDRAAEAPREYTPSGSEDLVAIRDPDEFYRRTGYRQESVPPNTPSLRMHRR